jgi:hypothetical protein
MELCGVCPWGSVDPTLAKLPAPGAGLPGNVDMITGSALTPLRESVTALPAPAYRQEGGASSRLAREPTKRPPGRCSEKISFENSFIENQPR